MIIKDCIHIRWWHLTKIYTDWDTISSPRCSLSRGLLGPSHSQRLLSRVQIIRIVPWNISIIFQLCHSLTDFSAQSYWSSRSAKELFLSVERCPYSNQALKREPRVFSRTMFARIDVNFLRTLLPHTVNFNSNMLDTKEISFKTLFECIWILKFSGPKLHHY